MAEETTAAEGPAPQAVVEKIVPVLFDERIDREHGKNLPTICSTTVGTVHARTPGYYMPLEDRWIPKYVKPHLLKVNMNSIMFHCIFHHIDILWIKLHTA
jgi:hypothetical protein